MIHQTSRSNQDQKLVERYRRALVYPQEYETGALQTALKTRDALIQMRGNLVSERKKANHDSVTS